MKNRARIRLTIGIVLTLSVWATTSMFYFATIKPFGEDLAAYALWVALVLCAALCTVMVGWFFPIYIIVGLMKLRDQRRIEIDELGSENVVHADPDGERKLHDYLTAMTSMEARIGLLQRSAPWVPPEQRPDDSAVMKRVKLSAAGWKAFAFTVMAGTVFGLVAGYSHGIGTGGAGGLGLFQLLISGAIGGVLVMPLAAVFALLFGKIETRDDAGASGTEAA